MCKLLQQQKTALADTEAAISYKERTSYPTPMQQATKNPPKRIRESPKGRGALTRTKTGAVVTDTAHPIDFRQPENQAAQFSGHDVKNRAQKSRVWQHGYALVR